MRAADNRAACRARSIAYRTRRTPSLSKSHSNSSPSFSIIRRDALIRRRGDRNDAAIGGLVFDFSDPAYSSGWGGFCEYTLANDHDAMVADGVATAEHGWFECYEIQRPVPMDTPSRRPC